MTSKPKALYHTFGCKLNFAETASVEKIFRERGVETAAPKETPDIVVINSCSVTAEADRKCRSFIRSLHRRYPEASILVTGCYAQLKPQEVSELDGVALVAGVNSKLMLADYLDRRMAEGDFRPEVPEAKDLTEFMPSCSRGDRTRYFLKVQDGCDYWCTYCTIPKARGRSRSGTIAQIREQAEKAAAEGGKEIVITGVNIGDFGHGREDNFLDLCRELDRVDGIERYRISSIEPNLLTDELIDFVGASRAFMPHFHIPLQCYGTELFRNKIERVRRVLPDAFIGVDLIVGARGETPGRFESSRAFVDSLDISHLHVFPYSERPGTRALQIEYAVSQEEKHRRVGIMTAMSAEKHRRFAERFIGTVRPVLLEHSRPGLPLGGFTDNYLRVETSLPQQFDNSIAELSLNSLKKDGETIIASCIPQ